MRKALLIVSVAVFGLSFGGGKQAVSTFTDKRDGQVYRIVEIGGAVWMAENLNYAAEGSKCYKDSAEYCAKYGRLYNWKTAIKACPAGFHLPDNEEWYTLVDYAGGKDKAGTKLKSTSGWYNNGNGTDDYGWSALPGGYGGGRSFGNAGYSGYWRSATEYDADYASYRRMGYGYELVHWGSIDKTYLFSVRCVADKEAQK